MPEAFQIISRHVRRQFERAAARYDEADILAQTTAEQMDARLAGINHTPADVLDLGCGRGRDLPLLRKRYPDAHLLAMDVAHGMVSHVETGGGRLSRFFRKSGPTHRLVGTAEALPLATRSVDLVWSNLMLNWLDDPGPALGEIHRVMRVGGMLMFATLGPDTLKELRAALGEAGADHIHPFIDMHDVGDALVRAGFGDPVMDMDTLTLTYAELDGLFSDLRMSGSTNASAQRPRGLGRRRQWQRTRDAYEQWRMDGRLPATFEIVYGHAWKPEPKTLEDGREIIRFQPRPGQR